MSKRAPARTRATRCGAVMARQRAWADSASLNTIASAAAGLPAPRVTLVPELHRAEGRLNRVGRAQVDPVFGREIVEREQLVHVVGALFGGFGPLRAVGLLERLHRLEGVVAVLGVVDLPHRLLRARLRTSATPVPLTSETDEAHGADQIGCRGLLSFLVGVG